MKRTIIRKQRQGGFTILAYCLMIFVVLGFTGLSVDVGYLQWQKRLMQAAADAGAMGALREMELGRSNSNPTNDLTDAATHDAGLNGFSSASGATITVTPLANEEIQVDISKTYGTYFMRILGTNNVTLSARAIAQTTTSYGSIGGCIFALNPHAKDALNLESGTTLNSSCSAISESDHTEAFKMAGSDTWNMNSHNAHIGVVGGYKMVGGATIVDTTVTPNKLETPVSITSPGDPLANIQPPTLASVTGGIQAGTPQTYPSGTTLSPGIYCGGISTGTTLHFSSGTYILAGGGFNLGSQAVVDGTHVTFYSTSSTGWGCGTPYGAGTFSTTGQAQMTFSAPTGGPLVGMLFFQDRTLDPGESDMVGGSGCNCDGALYFKKSAVKLAGNSSQNGYLVIVADTIDINGASRLGNNYTYLSDPNPFAPGSTGGGLIQ